MSRPMLLAVAAVLVGLFTRTAGAFGEPIALASFHYETATLHALRASGVRVMLPTKLPARLATSASVAVIDADRESYYVGFSRVRGCRGALSCTSLHVAGYRRDSAAGRAYASERKFALPDGTRGSYVPRDCSGAHCTESSLTFERAGTIYEIDANTGRDALPVLLAVAKTMRTLAAQPPAGHGR